MYVFCVELLSLSLKLFMYFSLERHFYLYVLVATDKNMYYRESFENSPIKMCFNSNAADTTVNLGDVKFLLRRNITLPNKVIGYVSLNELTIANTNYNINGNNNTLVLQDYLNTTETFTITAGNYTVNSLKEALNAAFAAGTGNFNNITVTYSDRTNKYTFTTAASTTNILQILATSAMNQVLGVEQLRTSEQLCFRSSDNDMQCACSYEHKIRYYNCNNRD